MKWVLPEPLKWGEEAVHVFNATSGWWIFNQDSYLSSYKSQPSSNLIEYCISSSMEKVKLQVLFLSGLVVASPVLS